MCRADRGVVLGLHRSGPTRGLIEHAHSLGVCGIDTAYNYRGFTSHRELARVAGDLLAGFTLSTKVGFFPTGGERAVHSLEPARLRVAVERSCDDLDRAPDVVLLHSPERSLSGLPAGSGRDTLATACDALTAAVAAGLCGAWGIATWDPRPVVDTLAGNPSGIAPDVLLLRAGLAVADPILTASEALSGLLCVPRERRWGMSPYGGDTRDAAWRTANLAAFLTPSENATTPQVAFRAAFDLPPVARVAVGTSSTEHLAELVAATELAVNDETLGRYRALIRG